MAEGIRTGLSKAELRRFGLTLGPAFGVFGALGFWRGHTIVPSVLGALMTGLVLTGLIAPARLAGIQHYWMRFGAALSRVTSPIFLAVVYFLVLTPVGALMRMLGKNPLRRSDDRRSHWVSRDDRRGTMRDPY